MIARRLRAACPAVALTVVLLSATPASAGPPERFFGVAPQSSLDRSDYALMGNAGVGTLRFQLSWAGTDPLPPAGDYDWTAADAIVSGAAANRIRALPFVFAAPPWVSLSGTPIGPRALAAWRAFLTAAVDRYGPGGEFWAAHPSLPRMPIRDWQIWNEENSPTYWKPRPDVGEYAKLLGAASDAIRARDPGARLILGGMYGTPFAGLPPGIPAWDFLSRLYRQPGAKRDFDGVASHPYAGRLADVRRQIERLRGRMARARDRRTGLWVTELGWASGGIAHPLNRGPSGQAKRLRRAFAYLVGERRELRIRNATWYSWRDSPATPGGLCLWCPQSGLLNESGRPKPAFRAFEEVAGAS